MDAAALVAMKIDLYLYASEMQNLHPVCPEMAFSCTIRRMRYCHEQKQTHLKVKLDMSECPKQRQSKEASVAACYKHVISELGMFI
ncbi:hypothetical protein HNY73_004642 [Argiope bruennichi]|uniref:Uncharacterized protein n=1 Tax=Argiope bruennichi TaxID=94029 RepID=A0A8T0FTX2_ARGBR|nr:hypothetical protein HNY73_004642 [Argiope bruennichi]